MTDISWMAGSVNNQRL